MNLAAVVLYNPLSPARGPVAARTILQCNRGRMAIVRGGD